jgi:AP-2 complex subunit mu-1
VGVALISDVRLINHPCSYRSTSNVKLPIKVLATVNEIGTTGVSYIVTIKTNFDAKLSASSLVIKIPTPLNTTNVECKVPNGKAKYVPAENVVIWK